MKRLFYILLLTFIGMTAFSQSPTKYVNLLPAYPPAIGETQYGNYVYTNSGLYLNDIILDSLPHYEIEHIPDQTVRYFEDGIGFYVTADSLHSSNVVYSYSVNQLPIGLFEFNANTGRFKFYPDASDYMPFTVTFTATSGWNSLNQTVEFTIMPEVVPENLAIQSLGEMPSAQDYTISAESHTQMFLNNVNRDVYSYSISGKDIVFDNNVQNKVWGLSGREDIYELNLFAERLYIRSALRFPHTNVNIYAREVIFEDKGNEIASINTTPSSNGIETNDTGMDGENAGNIMLHVKSLKANFAKRFILNGAQGQCSNSNGTPGNGGNGGVLTAPINIESYCDFSRGGAGLRYNSEGLPMYGTIIEAGQVGENGRFELISNKYSWIHPYYFAAVIRHINDSYLNNYFSYSKTTANDYYNLINEFQSSDEWYDFDATLKVELQDQLTELEGMLYKLNENLDYFGNPLGWAPMLSFEVYLNNYNNEIDRAMPTLYLNYWLQHIDQNLASWVTASQFAADEAQSEIEATEGQINSLIEDIPVLEDKITVLQNQIEETQNRLEQIKAELLRKAKHNVKKKNRLNKAFGIFKAAVNCVPVYGQIASGVLSVVETATNYFGISDTYGYETALTDTYQQITSFDYGSALGTLKQAIDSIDLNRLGHTGHQLKDSYNSLKEAIGPVCNSISNLHQVLSQSSAPNDQVQAEFDRLCSESAEYQNIKVEIAMLQRNYEEFAAILTQTFVNIVNLTSEVSNEMVTLDALRNDVFNGNSKRDLQAMQCVEKMRQRAMNRLVKYHYYMRKAYEYRLLKPYQGEFSLENMYNRLETLIDQGQVIFDNSTPANPTAYSTLSALFREEVSGIIEDVIDELTYNAPEQTVTIPIVIPKEELEKINANEDYILNLFELGVFAPDEENIRIVNFDVFYMDAHMEGNGGYSSYMDLDLKHNGISRFRKKGEVYWFNHLSKSMDNPNPHTWSIRYNPLSHQATTIGPSLATQSLLYSLLGGNADNTMLFSRPAAWSDIIMSKKVHTLGNADIVIDSLVLNLQYDFTRRPNEIRNIDITTSDGLLPYITCSEADRNGRSNGKGSFHRSYTRSSRTVTFTAMEKHGTYHFVNWTDRMGNVVSEDTELTVNKLTDQFYRANYERRIPVISVADTIYVSSGSGEYEVQIRNVGLCDIEMDWYVSDSLSTWVHVNGIAEGIDDGYFTFTYETMRNRGRRIDSLEILAPEIAGMSKMIYIVQDESIMEVSVSTNPEGAGTFNGAGFFEEGEICNLTVTANEGFTFVNWTENGTVVSTNANYSFTVTGNRNLVANFSQNGGYHFITSGTWGNAANWSGGALPGVNDAVFIDANCTLNRDAEVASLTITSDNTLTLRTGRTLTVTGNLTNTSASNLVIKDGAQLVNASTNVAATMEKGISAHDGASTGWYSIASPMNGMPIAGSNFLTPSYDLYRFNETNLTGEEWENYKANHQNFTTFEKGRGYLYANDNDFAPTFTGLLNASAVTYSLTCTNRPNDPLSGFNLIGNPFPHEIYKGAGAAIDDANLASGYYTLTNEGTWQAHTFDDAILPGQGILVKATAPTVLTIVKSNLAATSESSEAERSKASLSISIAGDNGQDQAYVYFGQGIGLDKVKSIALDAPSLAVRNGNGDFAIAHCDKKSDAVELVFTTPDEGSFTMDVNVVAGDFDYLHLIDSLTGDDVDLLATPSYTFEASARDDASRFRLVFSIKGN
jgi:hypothetical protein